MVHFILIGRRYADDTFYAFTRGSTFVALTNGGSKQPQISRNITYHPYSNGQKLCNLYVVISSLFYVVDSLVFIADFILRKIVLSLVMEALKCF